MELGEQLAVGGLADVFERSSEADESTLPTFEPYLEYGADAVREVSVATLDDLRQEATSRDSPSEQGSRRPKAAGRWRSVERR